MLAGLLVHIPELRVPVGMLGALLGLEGALQRVALLLEQPPDGVVGDLEPLPGKGIGELAGRLARPPQGAFPVPAGVRVDQLVQGLQQARVTLCQPLWPAAGTADAPARVGRVVQLPHAGVHRRAGQSADPGHTRAAAMPSARAAAPASSGAASRSGGGDQLVQPAQHGVHVHAGNLPNRHTPTATIRQTSHTETP